MNIMLKLIKITLYFCILCLLPANLSAHGKGASGGSAAPRTGGGSGPVHVQVQSGGYGSNPRGGASYYPGGVYINSSSAGNYTPYTDPSWNFYTIGSHSDWYQPSGLRLGVEVMYNNLDRETQYQTFPTTPKYTLDPATEKQFEDVQIKHLSP